MTPYAAIVLAGGRSVRLGTDKTRVAVEGVPVLERVLAAVADAEHRFVVGPPRPLGDDSRLRWLRESPPGSGPANGVACAVPYVTSDVVTVLAGDLPYVDAATVARLLGNADGDGAVLRDSGGRSQWLCAAVRTTSLRGRLASRDSWAGAPMRELLGPLDLTPVASVGAESHDIDTPDDIPSDP